MIKYLQVYMLKYEQKVAIKTLIQEIKVHSSQKECKLDGSNFGNCWFLKMTIQCFKAMLKASAVSTLGDKFL